MVDLMQAFSHQTIQTTRLFELSATWGNSTQSLPPITPRAYRIMQRLRPHQVDELVAAYQTGATVKQLAVALSVHRGTISKHLRARGIDTTPPGLNTHPAHQSRRALRVRPPTLPHC